MISMDMKYTSLYWALRFIEDDLDIHCKSYNGYTIRINAEAQRVDYGKEINIIGDVCRSLTRHKDFVILECVNRLILKGYKPNEITLDGRENYPDVIIGNCAIRCEQWGKDYDLAKKGFTQSTSFECEILYTSRLVSGLLEYKNILLCNGETYNYGLFEDEAEIHSLKLAKRKIAQIEQINDIKDFDIFEDELIFYKGKAKKVRVPEGITTIGASAFWGNTFVEEIILPQSLKSLGGDCFYYCTNLKKVNIPSQVWIMGNDPFAGCPELRIENFSKEFILAEGVLFNKEKNNLIHYSPWKIDSEYVIPNSVICLGKHSFYACKNLEKILIPNSVIKFENNPFSGCDKLSVENHSEYYIFKDGIIYNKFMTTIIGCLNAVKINEFIVPETVTLISRNSFWNCKGIEKIVISNSVNRIGYNPFAGCENLWIESESPLFKAIQGIVYNKEKTHILCATNKAVGREFTIPNGVTHINRGVFSGCVDLEKIDFNGVIYIDKSSFTNCMSLIEVYVPDDVTYIGEWAFAYCIAMKKISISRKTFVDKNAFNECPAKIEWRD